MNLEEAVTDRAGRMTMLILSCAHSRFAADQSGGKEFRVDIGYGRTTGIADEAG
jgi:hypothetical protein